MPLLNNSALLHHPALCICALHKLQRLKREVKLRFRWFPLVYLPSYPHLLSLLSFLNLLNLLLLLLHQNIHLDSAACPLRVLLYLHVLLLLLWRLILPAEQIQTQIRVRIRSRALAQVVPYHLLHLL